MAKGTEKTEHSGAKKGAGAYYGIKKGAKQHSRKKRRRDGLREVRAQGQGGAEPGAGAPGGA